MKAHDINSGIEAEVKKVEEKQTRDTSQRLLEAIDTSEDILECYRRINGHLERLAVGSLCPMPWFELTRIDSKLNANLSILKGINELTTVRMIVVLRTSADG